MDPAAESSRALRRPTRGLAIASAAATFWFSAAIGCISVRRWKRAIFWLLTDWVWLAIAVAGAMSAHPRLMWGGFAAFIAWRIPAAVDTYRLVRREMDRAGWPTLIRAWVVLTVGAIVIAKGVIRPCFLEAFAIPSGAMYPTLFIGDHIFVDKTARTPQRGDVIVFEYPRDRSVDYVKRVIGLPGDTIEISSGSLRLNGRGLPRDWVADGCLENTNGSLDVEQDIPCVIWTESIEGRRYSIGTERRFGGADAPPTVVPSDSVYVLGDNRDNSSDSRIWGPVPFDNIKGTVRFIWWSRSPTRIRWDRINALVR